MKEYEKNNYLLFLLVFTFCLGVQIYGQPNPLKGLVGPCDNSKISNGGWGGHNIICEDGRVFETPDSGATWIEKKVADNFVAKMMAMQKTGSGLSQNGSIVGNNGKIFSSSDNGRSWLQTSSGTTNNLNNLVYGWSPTTHQSWGFAVGDNSTVLITKDGGKTWTKQSTPYQYDHFYGVYFLNSEVGWIVGSMGIIYKTINSGTTWTYVEGDHSNPTYKGVAFSSSDSGNVVGSNGFIGRTTNGGSTWTQQNSGTTETLNDIEFVGAGSDTGAVVGNKGTLLNTTDGGNSWTKQDLGTTYNLNDVTYDTRGYIWIAGDNGILFTNNPRFLTPTAPSGLNATPKSSSQIDLSWLDNSNNESGFIIERKDGPNEPWQDTDTAGANVVIHHDTGLSPNKQYQYRVSAYNTSGESSYSNTVDASTLNVVPSKPTNLTATPKSSSQIDLSWLDNSNNETGFKIERKTEQQEFSEIGGADSNATAYTDRNLDDGLNYIYRVASLNTIGKSPYSNESSATTQLNAPTNLTAKKSTSGAAQLDWKDNSKSENGFTIEKKSGTGNFSKLTDVAANLTSYSDAQVSVGQQLSYRVQAFNSIIISGFSNTADIVITSVNNEIEIPTEYSLKQNYPNPFNPETIISYELPEAGYVTLKVFDILGNEIVTLVNNFKSAGKHYSTLITTDSKFTSGCYIYKLTAGSFSSVRKMLLIK